MKYFRAISLTIRLWNFGKKADFGNGDFLPIDLLTAWAVAKIIWK